MSGLYGVFNKTEPLEIEPQYKYFFSSELPNILNEEFRYKNFTFGRSVPRKLLNDRIIYEDNKLIIAFEGIIFNKSCDNNANYLESQYRKQGIKFIETIDGLFSGFIYDKDIDVIYAFVDHLNTRPIYYFCNSNCFIISSEVKHISAYLRKSGRKLGPDYDGIYSMLGFGFVIDDLTFVKEIKSIPYGSILEFKAKEFKYSINKFFSLEKKQKNKITTQEIVNQIDSLMVNNVQKHWNKDIEYNYNHYSSLSGGLDAKTQLLLAVELGFNNITTLTFAESSSSDANISIDVAKKNKLEHISLTLDNGLYLNKNIDQYVKATDGLMPFFSFSHSYNSMKKINHNNFGVLHSGQIGDLVFGSFIRKKENIENDIYGLAYHGSSLQRICEKISFFSKFIQRYNEKSFEVCAYEQRVINAAIFGDRALYHFTDTSSVFYDRKLIEFSLTIPDQIKLGERLYIEWLKNKHTNILDYKWQKCGTRPTSMTKIKIGKLLQGINNRGRRTIGLSYDNMNPFDLWFRQNPAILKQLNELYINNIHIIHNKELKNDLEEVYNCTVDRFMRNKFTVVTLLLALKMHLGEIQ
ncbi:MAG: asparagine synthase-related protein [Syntrophomonas sp.]